MRIICRSVHPRSSVPSAENSVALCIAESEKFYILHEDLSGEIIGAAMTVLNVLGPGLDEKIYERAMVLELRKRGRVVDQQKSYPVFYNEVETAQ